MQQVTAKEISLTGSFRFQEEFATDVTLMEKGPIDVKPLITHTLLLRWPPQCVQLAAASSAP